MIELINPARSNYFIIWMFLYGLLRTITMDSRVAFMDDREHIELMENS